MIRDDGGKCTCPHFEELKNGKCVCKPGFIDAENKNGCKCPGNETTVNSTCICVDGFIRNDDNMCICPKFENFINISGSGLCHCKNGK